MSSSLFNGKRVYTASESDVELKFFIEQAKDYYPAFDKVRKVSETSCTPESRRLLASLFRAAKNKNLRVALKEPDESCFKNDYPRTTRFERGLLIQAYRQEQADKNLATEGDDFKNAYRKYRDDIWDDNRYSKSRVYLVYHRDEASFHIVTLKSLRNRMTRINNEENSAASSSANPQVKISRSPLDKAEKKWLWLLAYPTILKHCALNELQGAKVDVHCKAQWQELRKIGIPILFDQGYRDLLDKWENYGAEGSMKKSDRKLTKIESRASQSRVNAIPGSLPGQGTPPTIRPYETTTSPYMQPTRQPLLETQIGSTSVRKPSAILCCFR